MSSLQSEIREKRTILRGIYGGMMSLADLGRELGMKPEAARVWAQEKGIGNMVRSRLKIETDEVAKIIVMERGMW